jgi:hypothetical protein
MSREPSTVAEAWWFADAVAVVVCLGPLVLSTVLTPGDDVVSLLGVDVPVLCQWRRLTGWGCPGCGLTRSFVFLGHLRPLDALRMNPLGIPFFLIFLATGLRSLLRLARGWRGR